MTTDPLLIATTVFVCAVVGRVLPPALVTPVVMVATDPLVRVCTTLPLIELVMVTGMVVERVVDEADCVTVERGIVVAPEAELIMLLPPGATETIEDPAFAPPF